MTDARISATEVMSELFVDDGIHFDLKYGVESRTVTTGIVTTISGPFGLAVQTLSRAALVRFNTAVSHRQNDAISLQHDPQKSADSLTAVQRRSARNRGFRNGATGHSGE